jgi:hypothetical protein
MMSIFQIIKILLLILPVMSHLHALPALYKQVSKTNEKHPSVLKIEHGFAEDGAATQIWRAALQYLRRNQDVSVGPFSEKMTSSEEIQWAKLIAERINIWPNMVDSLGIPFQGIKSPDTVTILLGNQGGRLS